MHPVAQCQNEGGLGSVDDESSGHLLVTGAQKMIRRSWRMVESGKNREDRPDGYIRIDVRRAVQRIYSNNQGSVRVKEEWIGQLFGQHGCHRSAPNRVDEGFVGHDIEPLLSVAIEVGRADGSSHGPRDMAKRYEVCDLNRSLCNQAKQDCQRLFVLVPARGLVQESVERQTSFQCRRQFLPRTRTDGRANTPSCRGTDGISDDDRISQMCSPFHR